MKKYIIIGNGVAAAGCIEGIRSVDKTSLITVISEEKYPVYCRPLISYYLEGKAEKLNYRSESFYEENGAEVLYGRKAVKTDGKKVFLDDGSERECDSVCICTGSSPFVPPFKGLDSVKNKFSFMTFDDALALEKAVNEKSEVLIIGAGLIGLKCAEGLMNRVGGITVCDLAPNILSSILDEECSLIMQKHLESHGIKFMLGDSAEEFNGSTAKMKSGKTVDFDILVLAVGVRANTAVAADAGCEIGRGIAVDFKSETSVAGIYAAGDCTECLDISSGERKPLAILPNAYMQGKCAGVNMAGGDASFDNAVPMNSIGFFGLHAMTAGSRFTEDEGEIYIEKGETSIKKLYFKDGLLKGFMIITDCEEKVGIYTSLIRERTPLDEVNFELLKKNPSLSIFFSEKRRKKLGGVV